MTNKHFTLVAVGDNVNELLKIYDINYNIQQYLVYEFKKAKQYKEKHINILKESLKYIKDIQEKNTIQKRITWCCHMSDIDFYTWLTYGYDIDEKTGNAYYTFNKEGKYDSCNIAKHFAIPLIDKNGRETYQALKKDVDWDKTHMDNQEVYEFVWDSVMNDKKPYTENEKKLYENMKNRTPYLSSFKNKETYVASNTSFWGYAFFSERTKWVEPSEHENQYEWIMNFFDRFITPLKDDEKITIYECTRIIK